MSSSSSSAAAAAAPAFVFSPENFRRPKLASNLKILDVPVTEVTESNSKEVLNGYGHLVNHPDDFRCDDEARRFEICKTLNF